MQNYNYRLKNNEFEELDMGRNGGKKMNENYVNTVLILVILKN